MFPRRKKNTRKEILLDDSSSPPFFIRPPNMTSMLPTVIVSFIVFQSSQSFGHQLNAKMNMDEIYVINLVRRVERHESMKRALEEQGLSAMFWPATDGKTLTETGLLNLGVEALPGYLDPYHNRPLTMGEIGCFLSHYFIWKNMIENTNYSKIVILEDDVYFTQGWKDRFFLGMEEVDWLNESSSNHDEVDDRETIDLIYLGRKQLSTNEIRSHHNFLRAKYSYWTIGYIITRNGAKKLLDSKPLSKLLPIDEYLPIMYNSHPNEEWSKYYSKRNVNALSFDPVLITPTHFVGDTGYISDTEQSSKLPENLQEHPKYLQNERTEL